MKFISLITLTFVSQLALAAGATDTEIGPVKMIERTFTADAAACIASLKEKKTYRGRSNTWTCEVKQADNAAFRYSSTQGRPYGGFYRRYPAEKASARFALNGGYLGLPTGYTVWISSGYTGGPVDKVAAEGLVKKFLAEVPLKQFTTSALVVTK